MTISRGTPGGRSVSSRIGSSNVNAVSRSGATSAREALSRHRCREKATPSSLPISCCASSNLAASSACPCNCAWRQQSVNHSTIRSESCSSDSELIPTSPRSTSAGSSPIDRRLSAARMLPSRISIVSSISLAISSARSLVIWASFQSPIVAWISTRSRQLRASPARSPMA